MAKGKVHRVLWHCGTPEGNQSEEQGLTSDARDRLNSEGQRRRTLKASRLEPNPSSHIGIEVFVLRPSTAPNLNQPFFPHTSVSVRISEWMGVCILRSPKPPAVLTAS